MSAKKVTSEMFLVILCSLRIGLPTGLARHVYEYVYYSFASFFYDEQTFWVIFIHQGVANGLLCVFFCAAIGSGQLCGP